MTIKISQLHKGRHRIAAIFMTLVLCCSLVPNSVFAQDNLTAQCLCGHTHDAACGFSTGCPASVCNHVHDGSCYTSSPFCIHTCNETCENPCSHSCDVNCYSTVLNCRHTHDSACGFSEDVPTNTCNHICDYINPIANNPDSLDAEPPSSEPADSSESPTIPSAEDECNSLEESSDAEDKSDILEKSSDAKDETEILDETSDIEDEELISDIPEGELTLTHETYPVTVNSNLAFPAGAYLSVTEVPVDYLQDYLDNAQSEVIFAYDIKIMIPSDEGDVEFQPTPDMSVKVIITPKQSSTSIIEITHIKENHDTGEMIPETVTDVTTINQSVAFVADSFSIYIGTIVNGATLILSTGNGFIFYSDEQCENSISGNNYMINNTTDTAYIYAKPSADSYQITSICYKDTSTGAITTVAAPNSGDIWTLSFPNSMQNNQQIIVETYVKAPGGAITSTSTVTAIASIFDETALNQSETNNISVSQNGSLITVSVKNNLLLQNTITIGSDVNICIISSGNFVIKRAFGYGTNASYMFSLNNASTILSLGRGTIQNNTITYHFNTGEVETIEVGTIPPASSSERYVTYTTVNALVESNLSGTLTIDGGADLNDYTGTLYSYKDKSRSTGNIIKNKFGEVNIWGGVTLQNNQVLGNDTDGGSAINTIDGKLNIYGGIIDHCICCRTSFNPSTQTTSSFSDGGALMLNGVNTKAIIYDTRIQHCESDNSSAISLWNESNLFFLNGTIQNNFSIGDSTYPAQAFSVYAGSILYAYGGTISNNQGINYFADLRISSSGNNVLHLFGGTIGQIGSNAENNTVNIHSGQVGQLVGLTNETGMIGTVNYFGGTSLAVTLPDAVNANGSQNVNVYVYESDQLVKSFYTSGTGTQNSGNADLTILLSNGTYRIIVQSASMHKTYEVIVDNDAATATPISLALTTPATGLLTESSFTFAAAGTENACDGQFSYGVSNQENGTYLWQSTPQFTGQSGTKYFKLKISGGLNTSESGSIKIVFQTPTISIGNDFEIERGVTHTFTPIISPTGFPINRIKWLLTETTSPSSLVVKNSNGSGTVTVAVNEVSQMKLKVELLDENGNSYAIPIYDELIITPIDKQVVNPPSYVVTIPEIVDINDNQGEITISGQTFNFTTEVLQISINSSNNWKLKSPADIFLTYSLFTNSNRNSSSKVVNNENCLTFLPQATEIKKLYYSVYGTTDYSGIYSDTLLFTVTLSNTSGGG